MELKESLKILRKELGVTQAELAEALHISKKSVSRWEIGESTPQFRMINSIVSLAKSKDASERCVENLQSALSVGRRNVLRVPQSKLYPVDRQSICALVDDSHNAVYVCDLETDEILYANHRVEEYIGKQFHSGEKCYQFIHGRSTPCLQCPKRQMVENESSGFHFIEPKTGRMFYIRGRKLLWNGKPAHAQYFFEETTALEEQDGFRKLVNNIDAGICAFWVYDDGHIQIIYVNDGYYSILDTTRDKRIKYAGFSGMNAIVEADRERVRNVAVAASKKQSSYRMRYKVLLDDGSAKELYVRSKFIRRENSKSLYYSTVFDIDNNENWD